MSGRLFQVLGIFILLSLSACAGAPAPGGTDAINQKYFGSAQALKERVSELNAGMTEQQVFDHLHLKKEQLTALDRNGIRRALFGGDNDLPGTPEQQLEIHNFLQQAYGYKLEYKDVRKTHGFSSPIRIRTEEKGWFYTVTMVFHGGRLIEKPVISGGGVNDTSSQTLFDFLNPGTALQFAR